MPKTTSILDCKRLADAVTSVGGVVPDVLGHLLAAHTLLSGPRAAEAPERDILTHALGGNLDEKTLDRLLAAAATAQMVNAYRVDLALRSEHVLVGEWHRQLEGGCADEILDAVRGKFQAAADQIARAPTLIPMQSSPEHILATAGDGALEAWRTLDEHIRIVDVIGTRIAAQFGPRLGAFPQVTEFPLGDGHRLEDRAICCTAGDLEVDSSLFRKPGTHRNSPWCQTELRLNTIGEAQDRYNQWAAVEFDRIHSGPTESWVDEKGNAHQKPGPKNPYRERWMRSDRETAGAAPANQTIPRPAARNADLHRRAGRTAVVRTVGEATGTSGPPDYESFFGVLATCANG